MQANDLRLKILLLVLVGSADRPTVERSFRQAFATPPLFHAISWQKLLSSHLQSSPPIIRMRQNEVANTHE